MDKGIIWYQEKHLIAIWDISVIEWHVVLLLFASN